MAQVYHKRGDTLSLNVTWLDSNNDPVSLTGYTIESQVRAVGFVDDLTVTVTDAVAGEFVISATAIDTTLWPITSSQASRTFCDIQFTIGGIVVSSETFQIVIVEDITQ